MADDVLVRLYYLFRAFTAALLFKAFLVFYYQQRGLSFAEIGLLQSVFSGTVILLEVPTGIWADRVGRRKIMGLGALIMALASAGYWFAASFWHFVFLEALFAAGLTLTSGADAAFIYDHLKKRGLEERYSDVESKAAAAKHVMIGLTGMAGGILASIDLRYLFPSTALLLLVAFAIARYMRRSIPEDERSHRESGPLPQDEGERGITVGYIWTVAYSTVVFILLRAGDTVIQPVLKAHGVSYLKMGFAVGFGGMAAALGAYFLSGRVRSPRLRGILVWGLPLALGGVYALISIGAASVMIALFALHYWLTGLYSPLYKTLLNEEISHSSIRATLLSTESAFKRFVVALVMPAIGFVMDTHGVGGGVTFCALLALLGTVLLFALRVSFASGSKG